MKKLETLFLLFIAVYQLLSQESIGQITGSVTDADQEPLPLVNVIIKQSHKGTLTDSEGKYSIVASRGDTLMFSHLGMHTVELPVKRSNEKIRIEMQSDTIALEEVEVKAKIRRYAAYKSQKELLAEYTKNKSLIKTSWRIIDKNLSSSYFRIIDGNDLSPAGTNFLASLQAHVPKMWIVVDQGELKVFLGITSPQAAIFDVDGFISDKVPSHINARDIYRVAILGISAGAFRYGPSGAGGVIVINTRAQTWMDDTGIIRTYDNRSLLDSLKSAVTYLEPYHPHEPSYIQELNEAKTRKKAQAIYESQKESYLNDPCYFLEVYDFFLSRWGKDNKSKELFLEVSNRLAEDVHAIKALAYLQQQYSNYESALNLYIQILLMQSWEAQPLRDVANAYAELGNYEKAWMYYTQYIDILSQLPNTSFDAHGEDLLITTEMMDILDRNKEPFLDNHNIESILDDDMRTRLVFEWNNQEAEFELQFVSPEGFFDNWEYKPARGYCSKQFFLGKENIGLWQVNIDYKGNQSEIPSYLKVSVYRNYGLASQHLEVKVYKLSEMQEMVQLFTLRQS